MLPHQSSVSFFQKSWLCEKLLPNLITTAFSIGIFEVEAL